MPKRRHRTKPDEPSQEQQWAEFRKRARPPAWWNNYSSVELEEMHRRGKQLVEGGYGCDEEYCSWLELYGQK